MADNFFDQFHATPPVSSANPFDAFDSVVAPAELPGTGIAKGFVRGMRDPLDAGAQLVARGLHDTAPAGSWWQDYTRGLLKDVEATNKTAEQDYRQNWRGGVDPGTDIGRVAGNVAATAPIAAAMPGATAASLPIRMASGFASGGLSGALQPVDTEKTPDFWSQKGVQAGWGAAGGAAAPAAGGALARVISPQTSDAVRTVMAAGAKPTMGQILGGIPNRIEEKAQSIPFVGDVIRNARNRGMDSFNRAAIDDALAPIGKSLNPGTAVGRDAAKELKSKISDDYDALLPKLKVQMDHQFVNGVSNVIANSTHLEPAMENTFKNIMRDKVARRFAPNGGMTGEGFKEVESELGRLATKYSNSVDAGQSELGGALMQVQKELHDMLMRSNPAHADELSNINSAYANSKRVLGAASKLGADEGRFTPSQLLNSIRSQDPTLNKTAFATGDARFQKLGDAGKAVFGDKVRDSGTTERAALLALGSLAGTGFALPPAALALGAAGGAGMAAYSPWGQGLARTLMTSRHGAAVPLASILRTATPISAGLPAALMGQGGN